MALLPGSLPGPWLPGACHFQAWPGHRARISCPSPRLPSPLQGITSPPVEELLLPVGRILLARGYSVGEGRIAENGPVPL